MADTFAKPVTVHTKKILIYYFPLGIRVLAPFIGLGGVWLAIDAHPVWGVLCLATTVVILTTKYITEISMDQRAYRDYLSVATIPFNEEKGRFHSLDKIVITKGTYEQYVRSRIQSRQFRWSDYTATLIMDNQRTLDLITRNDKRELLLGLKPYAEFLNVGVEDCTLRKPYRIDMNRL